MPEPVEPTPIEFAVAEPYQIHTFDPIAATQDGQDAPAITTVYEGLAVVTPSGEVVPRLATSWEISEDRRAYTLELRRGVTFHNGAAFTSSDVVYSANRALLSGSAVVRQQAQNLRAVEAPDDHTVVFRLHEPSSGFIYDLADPTGIGLASILTPTAPAHGTSPVGTGPFRFVSYLPGSELQLEVNRDYWDPSILPEYDRLTVRIIPEEADRQTALGSGDVVVATATAVDTDSEAGGALVVTGVPDRMLWLHASRQGNAADPLVVNALWSAIDRQAVAEEVFHGQAAPWTTSHPLLGYGLGPEDLPGYRRDLEGSIRLLGDAGHGEGIRLEFLYPETGNYPDDLPTVLVGAWQDAGILVDPLSVDHDAWVTRLVSADYDITVTSHGWYADSYRYLAPRPGWHGEAEDAFPDLLAALVMLSAAAEAERAEAFRTVQLLESQPGFPITGLVAINELHTHRSDIINLPDLRGVSTGSRRSLYLSLSASR